MITYTCIVCLCYTMLVLYFSHPNIHHARYKMPHIVAHHDDSANFKINYGTNYMSYIDILFICK